MAEVKNNFLDSKMNLDFDDRLIPNGQYRQAFNIAVGRSEQEDVGAIENVMGNVLVPFTNIRAIKNNKNIDCIGYISDNNGNNLIMFLTDYSADPNAPDALAPSTSYCSIYIYNFKAGTYSALVEGSFLNFSKANPIYGVNLIENLLFWTDNRNQPRKINITSAAANSNYYTKEVQISVAKYNPYEVINLIKTAKTSITSVSSTTVFTVADASGIEVGMTLICPMKVNGNDYIYVTNISGNIITIDAVPPVALASDDKLVFLISTMTNEAANPQWPGDPDYLQSRYVRFGYRFKFDDSEYSITSPFTQIAYIPEQKGYFVAGDEDAAYRSTVLNFMQNNVQNVELLIPMPDILNNVFNSYKIIEVDILYKQSDQTTIKVLDTIVISDIDPSIGNTTILNYNYQSRKPYKTLPEAQTVRVYDKVPTRAFAQETSGNRVIYGNFNDVYTPPSSINYTVGIAPKNTAYVGEFNSFIEYPNHTLKENRNYQAGIVLADKYGRQSPVILSSVKDAKDAASIFGGSTVYSPYKTQTKQPNLFEWVGDSLQISVDSIVTSGKNGQPNFATGEPGIYAIPNGNGHGFSITAGAVVGNTYAFTWDGSTTNNSFPVIGSYLRGKNTDYVKVIAPDSTIPDPTPISPNYFIRADGPISDMYNYNADNSPDIKFAYDINEIGWYSYKIVVKQLEQDYYNCYMPGILNGYPSQSADALLHSPFPTTEVGKTSHIVLLNDNINKIPRDLSEVGPDQKQYRSSVVLYGRVQNDSGTSNAQYYPGRLFDLVSTIANAPILNMDVPSLGTTGLDNFYQINTSPMIGRVSTTQPMGVTTDIMKPFLAIYETKPIESLLTIYWETSSTGLLSDLNENVLNGYEGPYAFTSIEYLQKEWQDPNGTDLVQGNANSKYVTNVFYVVSKEGLELHPVTISNFSVVDGHGNPVTKFGYEFDPTDDSIRIKIVDVFTYTSASALNDNFVFSFVVNYTSSGQVFTNTLQVNGSLTNITPSYTSGQVLTVSRLNDTVGPILGGTNGSFATSTNELYWVIDSISGPSITPLPFVIDSSTGIISQTSSSVRALGIYTLNVTLYDATLSSGTHGIGYLSYSDTVTVAIGETPINATVLPTYCDVSEVSGANRSVVASVITDPAPNNAAGWYVGNADVSTTTFPDQWNTLQSAGKTLNSVISLGGTLTHGTFGISVVSQIVLPGGFHIPSVGTFCVKTFYRSNLSLPWTESFIDINNKDHYSAADFPINVSRTGTSSSKSLSVVRAYDLPGEYFILVYNITTLNANTSDDVMNIWANVFDLFYSNSGTGHHNCVSAPGTNAWEYTLSNASYSRDGSMPSKLPDMYSSTPYITYARSFYKDSSLSVAIDSSSWLSTTPNLYYTVGEAALHWSGKTQTTVSPITLIIGADGNKLQTDNTAPYSQIWADDLGNNECIVTTVY